jgi:hypothetical protein
MTSLLNFITIYLLVPNLMGQGEEAHREDGDLISLHFSFRKESRLKNELHFLKIIYAKVIPQSRRKDCVYHMCS